MVAQRAQWNSKLGFILAAAGSAVGLGNIWKFPYITGENGGGYFVLIYLLCVVVVGLPIMICEILIGRSTQKSPVGAFRELSRPASPWIGTGWLGIAAAFLMLSFYSVVAGWTMHYTYLAVTNGFSGQGAEQVGEIFTEFSKEPGPNLFWHFTFMILTVGIVVGGIQRGLEVAAKVMMPALLVMMIALLVNSMTMEGFPKALDFVFGFHGDKLKPASFLAALGQAFFSLSIGMGAMITYGSYLKKDDDVVSTSVIVSGLDTMIALLACLVLFPITFSYGMNPADGPGLVFKNIPIALSQMPGGYIWAIVFFVLLCFAALTSAISLLEVVVSYFVDEWKWSRLKASICCGAAIALVGIPSALSEVSGGAFSDKFKEMTAPVFKILGEDSGKNWFGTVDYLVSNWMFPIGGLLIALFISWRLPEKVRNTEFVKGSKLGKCYMAWLIVLRFVVPVAVVAVFLNAIGVLKL